MAVIWHLVPNGTRGRNKCTNKTTAHRNQAKVTDRNRKSWRDRNQAKNKAEYEDQNVEKTIKTNLKSQNETCGLLSSELARIRPNEASCRETDPGPGESEISAF